MPTDLFRSIESKIARREEETTEDGVTVDLIPVLEPQRVITQRIEPVGAGAHQTVPEGKTVREVHTVRDVQTAREVQTVREVTIPTVTSGAASAPARAPKQLRRGRVLKDRYIIENRLGSGGMGTVYKAVDRQRREYPDIDAHVALKILHEDTRGRPDVLAKLRREFYCAQALSHRSIVKVYELDADKDLAFFTMELIDGELLSDVMQRAQPGALPRPYVWAIIREVGAGIAHAHTRDVIHSDLKPQNVMVTNVGEVRILDFGASTDSNQRSTALTPAYASCELLEGRKPDARDDLFALACMSYELLTGKHPFGHRRSTEARAQNIVPPRPPGLTRRQWRALMTGLAWERRGRSMAIRDWLAEMQTGSEPLAHLPNTRELVSLPQPTRLPTVVWWAWGAAIVIAVVGAWALLSKPGGQSTATNEPAGSDTFIATNSSGPKFASDTENRIGEGAGTGAGTGTDSVSGNGTSTGTGADAGTDTGAPGTHTAAGTGSGRSAGTETVIGTAAGAEPVEPSTALSDDESLSDDAPASAVAPKPKPTKPNPPAVADNVERIGIGGESYRIRAGENFAEIHVRRTGSAKSKTSFDWWTEPSSALAGTDYIPQLRTTTFFAPGRPHGEPVHQDDPESITQANRGLLRRHR